VVISYNHRGRLLPSNKYGRECNTKDWFANNCTKSNEYKGGAARRTAFVNSLRSKHEAVLLVDAGHYFHGSLFFLRDKGKSQLRIAAESGYNAMAISSSDFSSDVDQLATWTHEYPALPFVASNLDRWDRDYFAIKRYCVVQVNGMKVGILKVVTSQLKEIAGGVPWHVTVNPEGSLQASIQAARTQMHAAHRDCNMTILILGSRARDIPNYFPEKKESVFSAFIAGLSGVDVIFTLTKFTQEPVTSYRIGVKNVWVFDLSAGDVQYGHQLAHTAINWTQVKQTAKNSSYVWSVANCSHKQVMLDSTQREDDETWRLVTDAAEDLLRWESLKAGTISPHLLYGERGSEDEIWGCRWADCPSGHVVTDAMLYFMRAHGWACDFALVNAGALRASIDASRSNGTVFRSQVFLMFPYSDERVVLLDLTGDSIHQKLLNRSIQLRQYGHGGFLQFGNLLVGFNNVTHSVVDVLVKDPENGTWVPLIRDKVYKVALNSWIADGGDGYSVAGEATSRKEGPEMQKLVAEYFRVHDPLDVTSLELSKRCAQRIVTNLHKGRPCRIQFSHGLPFSFESPSSIVTAPAPAPAPLAVSAFVVICSVGGTVLILLSALAIRKKKHLVRHQRPMSRLAGKTCQEGMEGFCSETNQHDIDMENFSLPNPFISNQSPRCSGRAEPASSFSSTKRRFNIPYHELQLKQVIGSGSSSVVYEGRFAGSVVAIKAIKVPHAGGEEILNEARKEGMIFAELSHPCIIRFYGMSHCTEPDLKLFLVMQKCHATLRDIAYSPMSCVPAAARSSFKPTGASPTQDISGPASGTWWINLNKKNPQVYCHAVVHANQSGGIWYGILAPKPRGAPGFEACERAA